MPTNATASHEITGLLTAWENGEPTALDHLIPHVYRELKRLARRHMRGIDGDNLQTTAVVHEAYIRLVDLSSVSL